MYEGATQAYVGVLQGESADQQRLIRKLDRELTQAKANGWSWRHRAEALEARVAELEGQLAVKQAASDGHAAVVEAFKAQHAESPLLVQEGVLRNGNPRRRSTSIWIAAFDATARRLGIANPEAHRIA